MCCGKNSLPHRTRIKESVFTLQRFRYAGSPCTCLPLKNKDCRFDAAVPFFYRRAAKRNMSAKTDRRLAAVQGAALPSLPDYVHGPYIPQIAGEVFMLLSVNDRDRFRNRNGFHQVIQHFIGQYGLCQITEPILFLQFCEGSVIVTHFRIISAYIAFRIAQAGFFIDILQFQRILYAAVDSFFQRSIIFRLRCKSIQFISIVITGEPEYCMYI